MNSTLDSLISQLNTVKEAVAEVAVTDSSYAGLNTALQAINISTANPNLVNELLAFLKGPVVASIAALPLPEIEPEL